jgi:hypothetical protein
MSTSGGRLLPSDAARSSPERTLRMRASLSMLFSGLSGSGRTLTSAVMWAPSSSKPSTRARMRPWARMRTRPSGSFSMRMIRATVPMS